MIIFNRNVSSIENNAQVLLQANKESSLEINA
jgi:hypothetical protein